MDLAKNQAIRDLILNHGKQPDTVSHSKEDDKKEEMQDGSNSIKVGKIK